MTIKELMQHLETLDPNMKVLVDGYEGDYDDPCSVGTAEFWVGVNDDGYCGEHVLVGESSWQDEKHERNKVSKELAFFISRLAVDSLDL